MRIIDEKVDLSGRFEIIEKLADGGRVVVDSKTKISLTICPYCSIEDCLTEAIDAMDCPKDYTDCAQYQNRQRLKNRTYCEACDDMTEHVEVKRNGEVYTNCTMCGYSSIVSHGLNLNKENSVIQIAESLGIK
ncbi:MAG: hypothetical protein WC438_05390 [Candidatus Pacearchaeota archaeon]